MLGKVSNLGIVRQRVTRKERLIVFIDEALALEFSSNGATVYVSGRRANVLEKTAHELTLLYEVNLLTNAGIALHLSQLLAGRFHPYVFSLCDLHTTRFLRLIFENTE